MDRLPIARGMRPDRHPLDDDSAARMLQGLVQPDDAPPGYGTVAGLLAAAARPASVDEDAAAATVSAMVEAIRDGVSAPQTSRRKSMLTKLLAGKALAALGVVALTASGAAAATGSLPSPVQNVVSGAVSHVGVDLPSSGDHGKSAAHRQDGVHRPSGDDSQAGDDASTTSSTAGSDTSGSDNKGQTVSSTAHQAKQDGKPVGPTVCATASDGKCQAGQHGKGSDSGDDDTTSSTAGPAEDHAATPTTGSVETGEDHSDDNATTPTTGSVQTGEAHSGEDVGASSGSDHSGSGSDNSSNSGGRH